MTARASFHVNRVAGDAETDTAFGVVIVAFTGSPSSFSSMVSGEHWLERVGSTIFSDGDPATWELVEVELLVPPPTDYLEIQISAVEDVVNDSTGTEFDGHYGDDVRLQLLVGAETPPIPSLGVEGLAILALALALVALRGLRTS